MVLGFEDQLKHMRGNQEGLRETIELMTRCSSLLSVIIFKEEWAALDASGRGRQERFAHHALHAHRACGAQLGVAC